jgi:hypothetical protein
VIASDHSCNGLRLSENSEVVEFRIPKMVRKTSSPTGQPISTVRARRIHTRGAVKIEYDMSVAIGRCSPISKSHSTLHRFNFLRQFAAEKSFRPGRPQGGGIDGPCRIRTYNQRIMLTTTAFAALLTGVESEFVVRTIPSLYVSAV